MRARHLLGVLGLTTFGVVGLLGGASACAPNRPYIWVHEVPPEPSASNDYVIRVGDLVNVRVLDHETISTRVRVRNDGRMALPMLGDIDVAGRKPAALRAEIEARLKDFIVAPSVTINVDEQQPVLVTVLGEVTRPGVVTLNPGANIAQALATAGGLTEFADRDDIYIVRPIEQAARAPGQATPPGQAMRIRFTYEALSRGEPRSTSFALRAGDLVVVE